MSSYPRLLHPVPVELEQLNIPATVYDLDGREPVQQAARKTVVTLPCQVKYGVAGALGMQSTGITAGENGYVLFRQRDLNFATVTLQIGDRLKSTGNTSLDVYITRLEPLGHYPEWNNTLVKAYFADRQPSKQRSIL
jgi:hypothetical protein